MPVRKYRSIEKMPGPPAYPPLRAENLRDALSLMETAYRMFPWRYTPGVHKHRSIEEANRSRQEWETKMIRDRRKAGALAPDMADRLREIAARHGIRDIRIFGSYARGEAAPQSDLDLLVRLAPGSGFSDLMDFCSEAEAALGGKVDVVTEDGLSPFLRNRVLAEAIPL